MCPGGFREGQVITQDGDPWERYGAILVVEASVAVDADPSPEERSMGRKPWAELSDSQRRVAVVGGLVQAGLQLAALRDLRRRTPEQIKGPRWLWVSATFINTVGPLAYFLVGRRRAVPVSAGTGHADAGSGHPSASSRL